MTQMTQLTILYTLALDNLQRRIADERTHLGLANDKKHPHGILYQAIRDVADSAIPEGEAEPSVLLSLARENSEFATSMPLHWTFTEWEEAGNECTPIALIRENIYQWLVGELEQWAGNYT